MMGMRSEGVFMRFVLCSFLLLCGGCSLFALEAEERRYYVLPVEVEGGTEKLPPEDALRLLVKEPRGEGFIGTQRIIFKRDAVEQGYYQSASWVEPPTKKLGQLFVEVLARRGLFRSVTRSASGSLGDLQLNTEVLDFYHDSAQEPGEVVVRVGAELINLRTRGVIAQREFSMKAPVEEFSARGAVEAFGTATTKLLLDLTNWVSALVEHPDSRSQSDTRSPAAPSDPHLAQ